MTFALDLSKAIEKVQDKSGVAVKKITLELFKRVIEKSPVDTGRFRANWNVSLNSPDTTTSESTDDSARGNPSVERMTKEVLSYSFKDQSVYLCNSLPYAVRLEDGWSHTQAPNGMVRLSVIEIANNINDV